MLLALAVMLWLLIALPGALLLWRYGYADNIDVPIILIEPFRFAPRGLKWVVFLLSQFQINYLLATLFLGFVLWRENGWGEAVSSYLVASAIFSWAHNSARKRAFRKFYDWLISEKSHIVQEWDTLTSLASGSGVTAEEIATANGLTSEAPLEPGFKLLIPGMAPEEALQITHASMRRLRFWPPVIPGFRGHNTNCQEASLVGDLASLN